MGLIKTTTLASLGALIALVTLVRADGRLSPQGGTITAVAGVSGGGLTGGGTGGPVYLGLLTTCGTGQTLKWSGTAWGCADLTALVAGTHNNVACFTPDGSHVGNCAATDSGGVFTISEPTITSAINGAVVATTLTDAGIQAAIDAAPDGGTVLLESGVVYAISNTINVTKRMIIIDCQGWPHNGGLQVDAGMSTSSPVFLVKPPAGITNQGVTFRNCMIMSVSGAPASAGIAIDGTFGNVGYLVLDHVWINHLGGPAIKVQNASGLATGTPYNTHVTNASILDNGADFTNGGDSISIDGSSILTGAGSLIVDTVGGNFQMDHVTSILGGGIIIKRALAGIISHSNIEQTVTSTEANNCMIDVQGDATSPPSNFVVEDNDLQANSAFVGCTIRVDHAVHTQIRNNYVVQGATNSYTITANANRTIIDHNRAAPDNPVSSFLSDSGTNTTGCFVNQTSGALSCLGLIGMTSAAGATGVVLSSTQVKVAPAGVLGVSTAAPDVSGLQVALWSSGSNAWRMGTAYGDASANLALGTLDATGHITADTGLTVFDSPGTGLARDGTSPNKINLATLGTGAGSCTNCAVTFDAQGRETAYSSGTAPVTAVNVTAPITTTGGATPTIGIAEGNGVTNSAGAIVINNGAGLIFSAGALTYDNTVIQSRVSGTCTGPNSITAIAAGGTVTCTTGVLNTGNVAGTSGQSARFTASNTVGNGAFLDDGTNASIAGTFGIGGAATHSSTSHMVGAITADSTLTTTQLSVGSTTLAPEFGVQIANASSGVSPSSWNNQWATFGPAVGSTGAALGIGYNTSSTIGVIFTSIAPGSAFKAITFNASQYTFDISGTSKFTLDTSGNAAFAAAVTASTTLHLVGAGTFDSTLSVAGLLSLGAHVITTDTAITTSNLSSCGTGALGVDTGSTDTAGIIIEGTTATGCILTFTRTRTVRPFCTCTAVNAGGGSGFTGTSFGCLATATTLNIWNSSSTNLIVTYGCLGPTGST